MKRCYLFPMVFMFPREENVYLWFQLPPKRCRHMENFTSKVSRMENQDINAAREYRIQELRNIEMSLREAREFRAQLQADQERIRKARKDYLKELEKRRDNIRAEHLKIKGTECKCTRCTYEVPQK